MNDNWKVPDFFDPAWYRNMPARTSKCRGCGRAWGRCDADLATRWECVRRTGLFDPGRRRLRLDLPWALRSLGLDATQAPTQITLCVGCAVSYMRQFDERLAGAKGATA